MTQRPTNERRENNQAILDGIHDLQESLHEFKVDMVGDMKELKMKVDLTFAQHEKRITKQEEHTSWMAKSIIGLILAEIVMKMFNL